MAAADYGGRAGDGGDDREANCKNMLAIRPSEYPSREAQQRLAARLNLAWDESMQYWPCEVADSARLEEFVDTFAVETLQEGERFLLMELVVESANMQEDLGALHEDTWARISGELLTHQHLYRNIIRYWSVWGTRREDAFCISPRMRRIWRRLDRK